MATGFVELREGLTGEPFAKKGQHGFVGTNLGCFETHGQKCERCKKLDLIKHKFIILIAIVLSSVAIFRPYRHGAVFFAPTSNLRLFLVPSKQ